MSKLLAGITTYNPKLSRLKSNLTSIANQVDVVMIVDNYSNNVEDIKLLLNQYSNVIALYNGENKGIAYSMNQIGWYAYNNGFDWFLTLDQDSVCPSGMIEQYAFYMSADVGIISPRIEFNKSFISSLFHKNSVDEFGTSKCEAVLYAISSGQLINVRAWHKADGFWNYLFIDYVDQEFCFHLSRLGFRILRLNDCRLSHEPGINIRIMGIQTAKQSAFREYYWVRNSRLVYWLYKDEYLRAGISRPYVVTIKRICNSILVGEQVFAKLFNIYRAVIDAYKWKYKFGSKNGRIPNNIE